MRSALYYPHTAVKSVSLVKTALLLWDQLGFIVPRKGFWPTFNNPQIARAMDVIGIAHCPDDDEQREAHARIAELVKRRLPPTFYWEPSPPDLVYEIYPEKFLPDTWSLLRKSRLSGRLGYSKDYPMSEPAALTIMSILADCCAGTSKSRVTDRGDAYATLTGFLGSTSEGRKVTKSDAHEQLVAISLKVIDVPETSLNRLIAFREREERDSSRSLRDLRHRYLSSLETYVSRLTSERTRKSDAHEIRRQFAHDMESDWKNFRRELRSARIETMTSREILVTAVAGIGTVASWAFGDPVALPGVGTIGSPLVTIGALIAARTKYLSARYATMQKHPMAYLHELQKGMRRWGGL